MDYDTIFPRYAANEKFDRIDDFEGEGAIPFVRDETDFPVRQGALAGLEKGSPWLLPSAPRSP